MSGKRLPATVGYTEMEPLDAGTSARIAMPAPAVTEDPRQSPATAVDAPRSGGIPYALGRTAAVRIPVPGTNGICIELRPRGRVPSGGATSTLFVQDATAGRHLRLDYGYNVETRTFDYHWNQKETYAEQGMPDHAPASRTDEATAARYFQHAGRMFIIGGITKDTSSVVRASNPIRYASQAVSGSAAAWAGCEVAGADRSGLVPTASPVISVADVPACIIGGIGGYYGASAFAGDVYDWPETTFFTPLREVEGP